MKTYILYHKNCFDGTGAAFAAWLKLRDDAIYIPCAYGEPLPSDIPNGATVYMIDFSGPRDVMLEWGANYNFKVLDHHASAQKNLEGLPFAHFDMTKSGAVLSWEHFHPGVLAPTFFQLIQDRDLWEHKMEHTHTFSASLASYPHDFKKWEELMHRIPEMCYEGAALLRSEDVLVGMIVDKAHPAKIGEYSIMAVNATSHWSKVGNLMCKLYPNHPFCGSYYYNKAGNKVWSLRSIGDFDVSAVASKYGGGGHKNASGFVEK